MHLLRTKLLKMAAIAGVGTALLAGYAYAAGWLSPARLTPARFVDRFQANAGMHAGFRRNHAKGVCVVGYFEGNGNASPYSSAAVFGQVRTPVIGRFAVSGGNPAVADTSSPVRSLALQFTQANGEQWRTGMINVPIFVVNTPHGFFEFLQAAQPDPASGKPDPAHQKAFFTAHPESASFRQWLKDHPPSSSFVNTSFYSDSAFQLIDKAGHSQLVRWAVQAVANYNPLPPQSTSNDNVLQDDLAERLRSAPAHWRLLLQLARPGDPSNDATRAWPNDRQIIDAGMLTLERSIAQDEGPCRDTNFDPTILPRGIRVSDDPLLAARSGTYARAYNLRTHEQVAIHRLQGDKP